MGYELLLNVTGTRVAWRDLFDDAIRLADNGVQVYEQLAEGIAEVASDPDSHIQKFLTDPNTTHVLKTGDTYYNKKLAETLRKIAGSSKKGRFFHSGDEIEAMVGELRELGGIHTLKDFQEFRAEAPAPTWALLSQDEWLFTTPVPTSGPVLAFVVSVLDKFRHRGRMPDDELSIHRLVEALKFGFARRFMLGDPEAVEIKKVSQWALLEKPLSSSCSSLS
ncbi:scoloptoxin SSD14-like [Dermacentor andersoni]|uniref:scoloptoxin SSD14-like n=1 Tax=Dermacentor andersoni TaxID=34620 RepID=UPI0021551654|nr:scoloptoxin SSD14-like [Dermacentor andersoni]